MAVYVMPNLHGRHDRYTAMFEMIKFNKSDTLYIHGDSIDGDEKHGAEPIKLISDMMKDPNIINLKGNHELWALPLIHPLKKINFSDCEILGYRKYPFKKSYMRLGDWLGFGGMTTLEGLVNISHKEVEKIIDYIDSWGFYTDITVGENLPLISEEKWTFSIDLDYNAHCC
ncbi:MAG: hypothetical protein FWH20_09675 [Oscillospiraceae bacterium]|nr:hypothetical protein [Oscillospiraceae bacterium]